jgi:hypothetical protein
VDQDQISTLIQNGMRQDRLLEAQRKATRRLAQLGMAPTCARASAATLSALLGMSGIPVPMIVAPGALAHRLADAAAGRAWSFVDVTRQRAGDIGLAFEEEADPEEDLIFLVLETRGKDEMLVVDHAAARPHRRSACRASLTPTAYFLRATP